MTTSDINLTSSVSQSGPNQHLSNVVVAACEAIVLTASAVDQENAAAPRTELDSHANMVVLGSNAYIFETSGRTCNVKPFSSDLGIATDVPIVDGAIAYDCPYSRVTYIMIIRNALYIPSMKHNLIPPFIMREGGVDVNDVPKIHCKDPTVHHHCLTFPSIDLRVPLQLLGTFSYFHTRKPDSRELFEKDKIFITPDSAEWNPHCISFEQNERAMLNYEGEMNSNNRRTNLPMQSDDDPAEIFELASVTMLQLATQIDSTASNAYTAESYIDDTSESTDKYFAEALSLRGEISKMQASLGSTTYSDSECSVFRDPFTTSMNNLEESLKDVMDSGEVSSVMASIQSVASAPKGVKAPKLSKLWLVTEKLAEAAIEQNTQLCRHSQDNILSRQFSSNDRMLRYRRLNSAFFSDTMFANPNAKSSRGNSCCQVFVSDKGFVAVYPMKSQEEFQTALHWFCKQVGVPISLIVDAHKAQTSKATKRFCHQVGTTLRILEKGTPWANRAELYIGLLKEAVRKDLRATNSPMVLWDYAIERRALIHNAVPRPLFQNNGLTPHSATFGVEGDISKICNFGWYEWVYYRDHGSFPENKQKLGRVLGPIPNEGNEMAQGVLTSKGTIVPRRTIRKLNTSELHSETEKRKRQLFDDVIRKKLGDAIQQPTRPLPRDFVPYSDGVEPTPLQLPDENDPIDSDGTSAFEKPITDYWIHADVSLPQGEKMQQAKVIGRTKDSDGNIIGKYSNDPLTNTLSYDVEFPDGEVKEYCANVIAENMYAQVDAYGRSHTMLDSILDHRKHSSAIEKADMYITTKSGTRRMKQSTSGWDLLILWKNGTEEWIPLKLMKEYNPVEVAEFACSRNIDSEPAFAWWVPFTIRRRDRIIATVNSRVKRVSHKYGIEVPRTVKEAYLIDERNGNTLWRDAINKEMNNLKVAFDILPEGKRPPPGYSKASGHIIFDVRMTLERKA